MSPQLRKKLASRASRTHAFGGSLLLPGDRVLLRIGGRGTLSSTYEGQTRHGRGRLYDVNLDDGRELRGLTWFDVVSARAD